MPTGSDALRLFIAIELPEDVRAALAELQKRLQTLDRDRAMRWSGIDGVHLTLKFIGETPAAQQGPITEALIRAAQGKAPFALAVEGAGCFPNTRKPRVVWAGLAGDLQKLHALRDAVEAQVAPLGYPTEARDFSPHLTLGRARQEASGGALAALGAQIAALRVETLAAWSATGVSLMRSELKPGGAVYTQLAHIELK